MATQNVKILLRRGLRHELTSDILDTGELGFTTDTNQLFIGIDSAINEIQFDPFINAHAIIQDWLNSEDCPIEGLTVDEDLVIRNIPASYDLEGNLVSGVEKILSDMHFYIQTVTLSADFNANVGDRLYQRRFVFADDETDPSALKPGKTYQIRELRPNSDNFLNNASGTLGKTFSSFDNFTVRNDYGTENEQVPNPHEAPDGLRVVEVLEVTDYTSGSIVGKDEDNNNNIVIEARLRSGHPHYFVDSPFANNYYHFNGDTNGNLKSDFGLFEYGEPITSVEFSSITLRKYSFADTWEVKDLLTPDNTQLDSPVNNIVYPNDSFGNEGDFAKTEYNNSINFFQKVGGVWSLLGGANEFTGELTISFDEPQNPNIGDIWVSYYEKSTTTPTWFKKDVTIIDEAENRDDIVSVQYNGEEVYAPSQELYTKTNIGGDLVVKDHVVVTKSSKVTYWKRDTDDSVWKLLGSEKYETGLAEMNINTAVHEIPMNVVQAFEDNIGGYWKVIMTENKGTAEETVRELENTEFWFWYYPDNIPGYTGEPLVAGQIYIPGTEGDAIEDEIEIRYYYHEDFQFSVKPPEEFTRQYPDGSKVLFDTPSTRSNGDALVEGDYYVYTDKDIFGGTKLNIFQWNGETSNYQHDSVPVFYSDDDANTKASDNVLLYAKPYKFENNPELSVGILELRMRDYETSTAWFPYTYSRVLSYFFTTNPIKDVSDLDLAYALGVETEKEFQVGHMGRARRNVEVVTENSFNQLFADQHLSAHDATTGLRSSLFRKTLDLTSPTTDTVYDITELPIFLKFNKELNSVFFIDYSLKQVTASKTFLRVGQLKVINGYPNGIPDIKLTDENTEIWHDNLVTGNEDTIEDTDEFSNITFDVAIRKAANGDPLSDMYITYTQNEGCYTEISYTIKRWTM